MTQISRAPRGVRTPTKAKAVVRAPTLHAVAAPAPSPTDQTYGPLQAAFEHFNRSLFEGALAPCLITLQRAGRTKGYYHARKFAALQGDAKVDEIAMNPAHFRVRTPRETCSTLVHEMVHAWQEHFGRPGKPGYHDKQWLAKMVAVGLMPSSTGAPGGKMTGYTVSHYIIDGGAYDQAFAEFERTGAAIGWGDAIMPGEVDAPKAKRIKFSCPACGISHQLVPSADLKCAPCNIRLEPVGGVANQPADSALRAAA